MGSCSNSVLVTCATGFLGRVLCKRLQEMGSHVVAAGPHPTDGPWDAFRFFDLTSPTLPDSLLQDVDTIFHLASKAHSLAEGPGEADSYRPIIVEGTKRLLVAAERAGVSRFIYASSVKAMGEGNPKGLRLEPIDETRPHTPQSPYGVAKAEAEDLVRQSHIPHAVILRPVMVYGPGGKGNLPRMISAVVRGRFPPVPDNRNHRSMIHVEDLVEYMVRASYYPVAGGRTYLLTGVDAPSTRQLYDAIRESRGLRKINWAVPLWILNLVAAVGSLGGLLTGRRMPLDLMTLHKLMGSAWYTSDRASSELGFVPRYKVLDWLKTRNFPDS